MPVLVCPCHSHRSYEYRSLLYHEAGRLDQFSGEVQALDLASYKGLEAEVERHHPVLSRSDLGRMEDCCG